MHGGILEQNGWLWVVVMVRDCGAETPGLGEQMLLVWWEHEQEPTVPG